VQIPTQKSRILCFCLDGQVKRPDARQSTTFVRTTWQYHSDSHQCLELRTIQSSICPDVMVTRPDALQSSRRIHRLSASVRTTWQYRPDTSQSLRRIRFSFADTDMGRQLRLSGRQVYTIRTPSLIRQDVGKNCNHPDVRVTLFER
jgi:hypothetical protein